MDKSNKFLDNLTSYGVGYLVGEMAEHQQKIVEAVKETGRTGSVTLKLSYKMNGEKQVIVNADITPKIPRKPVGQVVMFTDDENQLHEENPAQLKYNTENVVKLEPKKVIKT